MSAIRVAVVNWTLLDEVEVSRGIDAMQEQLDEDFGPVWQVDAELKPIPSVPNMGWPGYWGLILLDERLRGDDGDGGRALTEYARLRVTRDGHPLAKVVIDGDLAPRWTHRASHVLLEMLVDPDRTAAVLRGSHEPPLEVYRKRVCAPCAQPAAGYERQGQLVTDFVHPAWFGSATVGDAERFDQRGLTRGPFEVLTDASFSPLVTDVTRPLFEVGSIQLLRGQWPPP